MRCGWLCSHFDAVFTYMRPWHAISLHCDIFGICIIVIKFYKIRCHHVAWQQRNTDGWMNEWMNQWMNEWKYAANVVWTALVIAYNSQPDNLRLGLWRVYQKECGICVWAAQCVFSNNDGNGGIRHSSPSHHFWLI